jgi:hypothetical protein
MTKMAKTVRHLTSFIDLLKMRSLSRSHFVVSAAFRRFFVRVVSLLENDNNGY